MLGCLSVNPVDCDHGTQPQMDIYETLLITKTNPISPVEDTGEATTEERGQLCASLDTTRVRRESLP